ncbi:hypothetical protein J7K93_13020 [bacterium]|nr:hypothetical protein [bacterium]
MKHIKEMSLGELAAYICTHLQKNGIHCVLTGGACVSIYTENRYESFDLDFVENVASKRKYIIKVLSEIGFKEDNKYFKHDDTKYFIEFPAGPLAIGREPVHEPDVINFETGKLVLLSPTDSVKDRLAAYYHWNDKQCLDQAVLITENNNIDIDEIKRWSEQEGKLSEFDSIKEKLLHQNKNL